MSGFKRLILNYGHSVTDTVTSPFEAHYMLFERSYIKEIYNELTDREKRLLLEYDKRLFEHAEAMYKHISRIYDFRLSKEPLDEWWYHLDKVVDGSLKVNFKK